MPSSNPLLTVTNLVKRYGDRTILNGTTFQINEGERIALMGPSGAGKSTLLNCISGIDRPDEGSVKFRDRDLASMDSSALADLRRTAFGHVFQFFHLLPTLTAAENIELPLQLAGMGTSQRHARVATLLEQVGLSHRSDALPSQMSGGEMQRVAIARAIAAEPPLIFADEPTGNLDSSTGQAVLKLLENITDSTGTAMLMVTHSEQIAESCHSQIHLLDGEITDGQPA